MVSSTRMKDYNIIKTDTVVDIIENKRTKGRIWCSILFTPKTDEEILPSINPRDLVDIPETPKPHDPDYPKYTTLDEDIAQAVAKIRQKKAEKAKQNENNCL
jgi:hypothetical protein